MNLESNLFWVITFGAVLVLSLVVTAFGRWCLHGSAVPFDKLNRLKVGMTMAQVREIFGEPWREGVKSEQREWRFGHRLKSYILIIRFNNDGKVSQFQHKHGLEPGERQMT